MKRAVKICNDVVTKHVKIAMGDNEEDNDNAMFVYHNTNKCYKSYTHSRKLKSVEERSAQMEDSIKCETQDEASTSNGLRKTLCRTVAPYAPQTVSGIPKH